MPFGGPVKMHCDRLDCIIANRAVCERRIELVLAPVFPVCVGCDIDAHLSDPKKIGKRGLTTYSEPPTQWYNLPFYRLMIGEEVCRSNRPNRIELEPLKLTISTAMNDYRGPGRVDVTFKTGDKIFAPTKELVYAYKYNNLSEEDYTEQYLDMMRVSYKSNRRAWLRLISRGNIVLTCYCESLAFCHRHLLKNILAKICQSLDVEFGDCGEL